jgi:hypothetical protein
MPSFRLRDMCLELGLSFRQMRLMSFGNQVLLGISGGTRRGIYLLRGLYNSFSKALVHI